VTIAYPTLRFFAASPKTAWLNVDVVYDRWTFPSGPVKVGRWSPSRLLLTGAIGLEPQHMSVRITNISKRTVRVDDVFVDPYRRS
jgi:hypothetical protein